MDSNPTRFERWADLLALNRTVAVVLATVLFFGLGEQLWESFMPAYLEARTKEFIHEAAGAGDVVSSTDHSPPTTHHSPLTTYHSPLTTHHLSWQALAIIGLYAFLRNLFEGFCYIGGGQITARLGDRGSLILFALLTLTGYTLFLASSSALMASVAALLILGWEPLSVPVTFTTVGSSVEQSRQGMAFAIQSIQKRLPKVIGPFIAGSVITYFQFRTGSDELGRISGMQSLVVAALALGLISLFIQFRWMPQRKHVPQEVSSWQVFRSFHPTLRRLLIADILTRWCDWLVREFVVVYVLLTLNQSDGYYGLILVPLQHLTALATYLPIGGMTRRVGLQPFIGLTFIFFALFPLSLASVPNGWGLTIAFIIYGLREIGEPARKALITSLMPEPIRARGVGLYWGLRSFAICSSSLVGAWLWYAFGPQVLLHAACVMGCLGAAVFYCFCNKRCPE